MDKRLPIGISDYKKVIEGNYYFIDKTLLIKELLEISGDVILLPRPRRFGKTLNLSMLRYFFEQSEQSNDLLFAGKKIARDPLCLEHQGRYPVIYLTLKELKSSDWKHAFAKLRLIMAEEFQRHAYLLDGNCMANWEREQFEGILNLQAPDESYELSLKFLSNWLYKHHQQRVMIFIDEYDAPAHSAYLHGYYEEMILFLRNWLTAALKDNPILEKGVLTGVLRIAKESIFSGLNNIQTYTLLSKPFSDKFGLLESEVIELLTHYGLEEQLDSLRQWFDGYCMGDTRGIYNPWSILQSVADQAALSPYWVNTSDNALIQQLLIEGGGRIKGELEQLLNNIPITKKITEGIVFPALHRDINAIWNLFLFSGYLTLAEPLKTNSLFYQLKIPNREIFYLFETIVMDWFNIGIQGGEVDLLFNSLLTGNIELFQAIVEDFLINTMSYYDLSEEEPEKIYHALILGMLVGMKKTHTVKSNRESGYGRYDVMLIPKSQENLGIVMEFKKVPLGHANQLEKSATAALQQIKEKQYGQELIQQGISNILFLGLAFQGKQVRIKSHWLRKDGKAV